MVRYSGPNAKWLQILGALQAREEQGGHRYWIYGKAITSLKNEQRAFSAPGDLKSVKFIGPSIVADIQSYDASGNDEGPTRPAAKPRGRPPKRSATDADLAPPRPAKRRVASEASLPPRARLVPDDYPLLDSNRDGEFKFWYLDPDGNPVRNREQAETSFFVDPVQQLLLFKVVYPVSEARHQLAALLLHPATRGPHLVADMLEPFADPFPQCPGFDGLNSAPPPAEPARSSVLSALLAEEDNAKARAQNTLDPSRQLPARYSQNNAVASGSTQPVVAARSHSSLKQPAAPPPRTQQGSSHPHVLARAATALAGSSSLPAHPGPALQRTVSLPAPAPTNRPRLSHAIPAPAPIDHPSIYLPQMTFPEFAPFVLRAGSYTVQMVLDTRERAAAGNEDLQKKLHDKGLQSIGLEALRLGDVMWVAQAGGQRYALDVVLERKRLDDLVGSIKDGRFHEQKFRLRQSAISRVFYLVEDYNVQQNREEWGVQISTALSSTQVVDGFLVKETKSIHDTVSYLAGLTQEIAREHKTKDLYVIPSAMIKRHSYLDLQAFLRRTYPNRTYITSFEDFQALNSKSGFLTVRDTWARMLLCVRGMGAEKVGAVLDRWTTPRTFGRQCVPEARMMLRGIGGAEGGMRAIGPKLSSTLYDLFMMEDFEGAGGDFEDGE
ncbi:ERCC4 domain-containing protein [Mycena amicta]|nr:ERCC4 domain-containing protein [Mycena amicta]